MRIISVNTNGIRAAARKGFFSWMVRQRADVICIQETKAQVHQLEDKVFWPRGYHACFHDAEKKGYSGVAIYCKRRRSPSPLPRPCFGLRGRPRRRWCFPRR